MRIGIEAMLLWGEWTGLGRYAWELSKRLAVDGHGHEYVLYTSRGFTRGGEISSAHFRVKRTLFHAKNRTLRVLWQQMRLPFVAVRDRLQLLHATAYVMPILCYVPTVVTVHDVIALERPELVRRSSVSHLRRFLPRTLERAQLVIVPSRSVARGLKRLFPSCDEKLRVIPLGVGPEFKPAPNTSAKAELRSQLGLARPYVLFVGRVEPKKNVKRVVEAFFAAAMSRRLPHELVIAGPGSDVKWLIKLIEGLGISERVKRLGYVPDEKLPALYAAAELLLMPSLAEGFGLPVLEAMASGIPCIISRDPALMELAGGAAIKAPADNLERLREAVERVLTSPELSEELRQKGLGRAREFSWDRTVELTVAAYQEARARFDAIGTARGDRPGNV